MLIEIPGYENRMRVADDSALLEVRTLPNGHAVLTGGTCRVTLSADDLRYLRSELDRQADWYPAGLVGDSE